MGHQQGVPYQDSQKLKAARERIQQTQGEDGRVFSAVHYKI